MKKSITICADIIARYQNKYVLIERLKSNPGLALPGGKQETGELLSQAAIREFREETGLALKLKDVLGTYAEEGRDPRGRYISTVFVGVATGTPKEENGKTRILLLTKPEIQKSFPKFQFDHSKILQDYFKIKKFNGGNIP